MLAAPIMAIGGIIMALRLDVPLSSVILVAVPVMGVFIGLVVTRAMPLFRSMQKKIDRINQVTREVLSGVRVIRAFDRVGYEEQRFDEANADLTGTTLRVMRLFAARDPGPDADPEPLDGRHHVVRQHPGRRPRHADRRPDGLHDRTSCRS